MTTVHFNALPGTKPVTLVEHNDRNGCKWPVGEYPTLFCNAATANKTPHQYCDAHMRMGRATVHVKAVQK